MTEERDAVENNENTEPTVGKGMNTNTKEFQLLISRIPADVLPNVCFIPLKPGTKDPDVPKGAKLKDNIDKFRISHEQACDRLVAGGNVGIYALSGGLLFLDADTESGGLVLPQDIINTIPGTLTIKTRNGGRQYYYLNDGKIENNNHTYKGKKSGEIRAEWLYVVAPGSYVRPDQNATPDATGAYTIFDDAPIITLETIPAGIVIKPKATKNGKTTAQDNTRPAETEQRTYTNELKMALIEIRKKDDKLDELLKGAFECGHPSRSEADMAAAQKLYFWRFSDTDIAGILRDYRPYEKTARDDYIEITIGNIISGGDRYDPGYNGKTTGKSNSVSQNAHDYHFSDLGNAQRLKNSACDNIRFCYAYNKWSVWDGQKWATDQGAELETYARQTINMMYVEAMKQADPDKRRALISFALATESVRGIRAMIELAKSEPGIPIQPEELDTDKMLFNVQNGTIDLRTGTLKPHDRNDKITKISPVIFDQNATCPTWLAFLNKIFPSHQNIIDYLQRKSGYILTGETLEEEFDELYGTGGNGKSKLTGAVIYVMGEYHKKTNVETIQAATHKASGSAPSPDVAVLKGARLVTVSEPEKGTQLNEQRVKDWTGRDPITARHLHQAPFTFDPEFKLWIYTNYKLRIRGQDNGIWRRVKLIPFEVEIPENEIDRKLPEKLIKEAPGILNWMIKGCLSWQKDGLKVPDEIIQATEEYKDGQDYLGDFFRECCEIDKGFKAPFKWLHMTYRAYCELMDMPAQSHITFAETLVERKMKVIHTNKGNFYKGIRLKVNIEEKCHDLNSTSAGFKSEGVKVMKEFLGFFLNSLSYRELQEKPSQPSQPSLIFCGLCEKHLGCSDYASGPAGVGSVHATCLESFQCAVSVLKSEYDKTSDETNIDMLAVTMGNTLAHEMPDLGKHPARIAIEAYIRSRGWHHSSPPTARVDVNDSGAKDNETRGDSHTNAAETMMKVSYGYEPIIKLTENGMWLCQRSDGTQFERMIP